MRFFGRNLLLMIMLLQLMIPSGALLVQNIRMINTLGLFDTRIALMIPYWGSAFGLLPLRQTFREVAIELEEAARIMAPICRRSFVTSSYQMRYPPFSPSPWYQSVFTGMNSSGPSSSPARQKSDR